ncbi:MAG: hypothetical protein ACYTF0_02210 [Planctomycetota bacterium]|jgi:hypothetical protein
MKFDVSRDFLDGILLQHPVPGAEGNQEIQANGGIHFLPSSPDGTMHTAVVSFSLKNAAQEQPFVKAGWRFLFTSDENFDPKANNGHPFFQQLLVAGAGKMITVLNNLCLHANMPQIPISPDQLIRQAQAPAAEGEAPAAEG